MRYRYIMAGESLSLDADRCIGCFRCLEVCPHGVLSRDGDKVAVSARKFCMECGACAKNCPVQALRVESGVGCAAAVINGIIRKGAPSCDCGGSSGGCC